MLRPEPMRGVYAPILTAVREDYSADVERWIDHAQWLLANGCHGLAPFGTTSEANSFSTEERMDLLEKLINAGLPAQQMIVGVGCNSYTDTTRLARHAVELGAGGVLMLPPFYYKDVSDEGIFRSVAAVIDGVADDRLRVYLYHIPPIAQVGFSLDLVGRLITMYPQTVVGLKDSSGNEANLDGLLERFFGFGTFAGSEKLLLKTLRGGGAGTITAMANIIPADIRYLYDHWQSEEAEGIQANVNALRAAITGLPMIPALKRIVADMRQDAEWRHVRPPLVALNNEQSDAMRSRLPELAFAPTGS
jgi:4-hydroxy-tetrahydrodipicolinate synthase